MPDSYTELAQVIRSGFVESRHFGSLVALSASGSAALAIGEPDEAILPRSTYKPLQALGVLEAGLELSGEQLAVAIGSHVGTVDHQETVRTILQDYRLDESQLGCPPDYPEDSATRDRMIREGVGKLPICMNCSGKHAAMLAACQLNGWSLNDYLSPQHPLQQLIRGTIERVSGVAPEQVAVDGCGVPLFSTTVRAVATAFRALALAEAETQAGQVASAMREHPILVQGVGQFNTLVMQLLPGSIAKGGAEGVLAIATAEGASVGLKAIDGGLRATTVIGLTALEKIGAVEPGTLRKHPELGVPIYGGGKIVGEIVGASF